MKTPIYGFPSDRPFALKPNQRATLVHGLRVAATHFDDDAARGTKKGMAGIAKVLARQAAEVREIADRLEVAEYIRVGTVNAPNRGTIREA
jgi:hypothetical protein